MTSSKYNSVLVNAASGTADDVSISAGELTIFAIDATTTDVRANKDNLVLGQIKVNNIAGKNLEIRKLNIDITVNDGDSNITDADDTANEILENVEIEVNGNTYELTAGTAVASSND
jgi:hypothetical protein